MFSCVDSRGGYNELGTPGGDLAEFVGAVAAYLEHTGTPYSYNAVKDMTHKFINKVGSRDRPFYYHTSDEKLNKIFHHLADDGISRKPTVFPEIMPSEDKSRDMWLDALTTGKFQGCGHMRLMIDQFADFGLKSADVPRAVIRAFFEYWWPTAPGSDERGRVKMTIVQGPLDGHAIAIVDSAGCPGKSPAVSPAHGGSQIFLLHAKAVDDFRKKVLTPFFADYAKASGKSFDADKYYNNLKSLQTKQLGATLTYLSPANALPVYGVNVMAMPTSKAPAPRAINTRPNLANPRTTQASRPAASKPASGGRR